MNAAANFLTISIRRPMPGNPVFEATGLASIVVRAGAEIGGIAFPDGATVDLPDLTPGGDYAIFIDGGQLVARSASDGAPADAVGGFHFAPGGNASARAGGDATPAINPCSIWDAAFRPACPDPRGMTLVDKDGRRFWCDIYLLSVDHLSKGTSRHGETIADGDDRPALPGGKKAARLDYETARTILAHHGKSLPTYDEFRAAAFGVTEKTSADRDPNVTGLDAARTSRFGVMQATGNLWVWGTDGDPDNPRPSLLGGSWISGGYAGSRFAYLGYCPGHSYDSLSARGRCDHLNLE